MAAIQAFTVDNASPMVTNWTATFGAGLNGNGTTISPPNYTSDQGSDYDGTNAPSTADMRIKVTLGFTTLGPFSLYARKSGTTYIEAKFTPGSTAGPQFATPDTFQIFEVTSGTPVAITPSNTASGVHDYYPAWNASTKVLSLRHRRLATGDTVELQVVGDQVIVKINDIVRAHEACTIDQTGTVGLINYDSSGAADNTYTVPKGGDLVGRYVTKTGNDGASGLDGAPWLTLLHAWSTVVEGEVIFIGTGTYSDFMDISPSLALPGGNPFTPTSLEDPLIWMALSGQTVTHRNTTCIHTRADICRYHYTYNIQYESSSGSKVNACVKFGDQSGEVSRLHVVQGGSIVDGRGTGILTGSDVALGYLGGDQFYDIHLRGNGWGDAAGLTAVHNMYLARGQNTTAYCYLDGYHDGVNDCGGQGVNNYVNGSGSNLLDDSEVLYCIITRHLNNSSFGAPIGDSGYGFSLARGTNMRAVGVLSFNNLKGCYLGYEALNPLVVNCVFANNIESGMVIGPATTDVTNAVIRNSTFYNNPTPIQVGSSSADAIDTLVKNTIFDTYTSTGETPPYFDHRGASTTVVETTNLDGGAGGSISFVNAAGLNFQLTTADTSGTTQGDYAYDIYGYARPQDVAGWSRGAYEVPAPATDPIVNMSSSYSGAPNTDISLATVSVMGQGAEAIKAYLTITGAATLSCSDAVVTKEGGV